MLRLARLGTALALIATLSACDFEGSSLYDPDAERNDAPVVSNVTAPFSIVLAGVDVVTVDGQNFSATPSDNIVAFDDGQGNTAVGTVVSASPTRLEVKVPNLPNPALRMRVAVVGSQEYSNAYPYPLTPAFVQVAALAQTEVPFGIAADADGTLYVSLSVDGSSTGVTRILPSGERSLYFASTFQWPGLARVGDRLVGVRRLRAVFGLPEGGAQQVIAAFQPGTLSLVGVTGGPDGSIYVGGNATTLFRIAPDGGTTETPFPTTIRALASGDGVLYATTGDAQPTSQLFAIPLAADGSLGAPTVLADLPAPGNAIAAAADGTLYVGLNRDVDPVVTVSPSGAVDVLYPGVITGPATGLAYGAGTQLYMVRGVPLAPTQTSPPSTVIRIETRRSGYR